ncbi:MAG: hypothetical protein, partial [Olavius algarvensis Gamma 1 endosymbiont]
ACPKPAGCRRSRRTGLPARRLPSRQERQFACSVQSGLDHKTDFQCSPKCM